MGITTGVQPKSRRTAYIATAVVAAAVAVAVAIGVFAFGGSNGGGKSGTPKSTVAAYLNDLAKADAKGALSWGATAPPSTTFLTDEILKQQQAKYKITNIKVTDARQNKERADVHATFQFGPKSADNVFLLIKTDGKWKLDRATIRVPVLSYASRLPQPTLFGKPIANLSTVYVFPGPLEWGSQSKYFSLTDKRADGFAVSPFDYSAGIPDLTSALNDTGKQAVRDAVATTLKKCAESKLLRPPGCPQREYGDADTTGTPQDGTVRWTAPTDLSGLEYSARTTPTDVEVSGSTVWKATYRSEAYGSHVPSTVSDPSVKMSIFGTVDLSKSTPTFRSI